MSNKISEKDKKDWEEFLSKNEKLPNKDLEFIKKKTLKTKNIDLHGCTLDEANKIIEKFINSSYEEGVSKLIVVTGKGIHSNNEKDPYISKDLSILKYSVPNYIKENKNLMNKILKIDFESVKMSSKGNFDIILKKKSD